MPQALRWNAAARLRARPGRGGLCRTAHPVGGRRLGAPVPPRGRRLAERRRPVPVDRDESRRPPVVAYFGFEETLEEGEVPISRPVGSPSIPGVLLAGLSDQGYWTRGAITIADQVPNVSIAFNPAFEPSVTDLTPENVTGLAMAADGGLSRGLGFGPRHGLRDRLARPRRHDAGRGRTGDREGRVSVRRSHSSTAGRGSRSTRRPRRAAKVQLATPDGDAWSTTRSPTPQDATPAARPWSQRRWPSGRVLERWGRRAGRVQRRREWVRGFDVSADRSAGTRGRGDGSGLALSSTTPPTGRSPSPPVTAAASRDGCSRRGGRGLGDRRGRRDVARDRLRGLVRRRVEGCGRGRPVRDRWAGRSSRSMPGS